MRRETTRLAVRFTVYRYEVRRPAPVPDVPSGAGGTGTVEARWTLVPVRAAGYAGSDAPVDAHPLGQEEAELGTPVRYGEVEVPEGTHVASLDPPILDVPGRGRVALLAVMGVGEGEATRDSPGAEVRFRRA
jgi:hypothetical protein